MISGYQIMTSRWRGYAHRDYRDRLGNGDSGNPISKFFETFKKNRPSLKSMSLQVDSICEMTNSQ